jgi:hypothetical protein
LDSTGSGQGPVADCCECGDEPSGSCATDLVLVSYRYVACYHPLRHSIVPIFVMCHGIMNNRVFADAIIFVQEIT